jgi:cytochrome c oxidase subunit 2
MSLNTIQSVLDSAGIQAARIESLWWVMFGVTAAVYVIVMAWLAASAWRGHRRPQNAGPRHQGRDDAPLFKVVAGATALTVVTLFGLLVASIYTGRAVASQRDDEAMVIDVTAYQWWWNVEYQHPEPAQRVRTANELHLPLGRTVAIKLLGGDVIHSFWVPALHGKMDLIPGHSAVLWLRPDRLGVFRGQCAEFCGAQHARMAFSVVVEAPEDFERWIQAQRVTATPPASEAALRGQTIVQSGPCAMCHTVRGTSAGGRTAPDLTHVASRSTLASGTLPNTRDNLFAWLRDPQLIKPGNKMPTIGLSTGELDALVTYLEGLK